MTRYHEITDISTSPPTVTVVPYTADEEAAADAAVANVPLPDLQPYQFFAMLEISGHLDALKAFIAGLPFPQNIVAQAKLDHALSFQRQNELVLAAQAALAISDADLDALWTSAGAL